MQKFMRRSTAGWRPVGLAADMLGIARGAANTHLTAKMLEHLVWAGLWLRRNGGHVALTRSADLQLHRDDAAEACTISATHPRAAELH